MRPAKSSTTSGFSDPACVIDACDTLMFDMDGTLLDLAFDNYMWLQHIPAAYARLRGMHDEAARAELMTHYANLEGQLDWYCLDQWSRRLGLDVLALHDEQRARIGWLPGAEDMLRRLTGSRYRVLLVTNSHPDTLRLKTEATGIRGYFDHVYTSHDFGYPKEAQAFWQALANAEAFDPERTLFVDDTLSVLQSARRFGLRHLVAVTCPDSSRPKRAAGDFIAVERVADLLDGMSGTLAGTSATP